MSTLLTCPSATRRRPTRINGGTPSMVSRSACCQATAGSGATSRVCNTNPWTTSGFPPRTGSGRATGTRMRTLRESPRRKADGPTPWTSPPRTPKTRSGTPASDAGDGSATGHTKPWTAGLRCVCVCLFVHRRLISCVWPTDPPTADESSRSFQRHQLWRLGDQ